MGSVSPCLIELKIVLGVVIGDVLDHLTQQFAIIGQQTLLNIIAKQVAEDATEILVTRIALERAAISQHANKT